mgnify:CR=1 FL=1
MLLLYIWQLYVAELTVHLIKFPLRLMKYYQWKRYHIKKWKSYTRIKTPLHFKSKHENSMNNPALVLHTHVHPVKLQPLFQGPHVIPEFNSLTMLVWLVSCNTSTTLHSPSKNQKSMLQQGGPAYRRYFFNHNSSRRERERMLHAFTNTASQS